MVRHLSSLRFRLIGLILLAVLPAFGVILFSAAKHRDLTKQQVQRNALGVARAIVAEQERFFENAHQLLLMISRVPQVRDKNSCGKFLSSLLEPLYADLGITDAKANLVCSALPAGDALVRFEGLHHKRVVETHALSIGQVRKDAGTGNTLMDLGFPVLESRGVLRGAVVAALNLSWLSRLTAENHLYPGATFSLVDGDGNVFLRFPDNSDAIGQPTFAKALDATSPETEKAVESVGPDGVRRLIAFAELKSSSGSKPVYAAIDISAAMAFKEADRILVHDLITLGLLTAVTLLAAWFGADVVVLRRIRDIVAATQEIAAGKLRARTRLPYGTSELGQMARSFDELAQALEKRKAEADLITRQIQKQQEQQKALYDLNLTITSTLDLSEVLNTLLEEISSLFSSSAASVGWINSKTGALDIIAHRNLDFTEGMQDGKAIEQGLPLIVLKHQSTLAISNAQVDPRTTNPEFFRRHRLVSYLGMPLLAKAECLGVLSFYTKEELCFSPAEMNFLTALVNQAAIAIYNSHLYEQTRNQAIELEESNKIKDEFLGVMSHELRTPLNIIMNYAEGLRMGMFGIISRDQEKSTERIRSQALHLLTLINGILEIKKIESGSLTVMKDSIDLSEFMAENRSDYMMPMDKDLVLQWEFSDLPVITGDRMKLKQILTNLINNAIKFTDHGHVTISAQMLAFETILELKVADTGSGIAENLLPFVFDKFRQIDSTTTRNHCGAGLGLYIVKIFVELLGGTINVESRLGEGSVFTVNLPVRTEESPSHGDFVPQNAEENSFEG